MMSHKESIDSVDASLAILSSTSPVPALLRQGVITSRSDRRAGSHGSNSSVSNDGNSITGDAIGRGDKAI